MPETTIETVLSRALSGHRLGAPEAIALATADDLSRLIDVAGRLRDSAHPDMVSYSRKVFIPLTHLCRDVCHYCTFARSPTRGAKAYLSPDEVLDIARRGAAAGCDEALFTLGDKPELRWDVARAELDAMGFASTIDYLGHVADLVIRDTGLLPHLNPGLMTRQDLVRLRGSSLSMGLMLESGAERLCQKGGAHHGSPDKDPAARLETIALAGELAIPFTSGILIGIGETRRERIEALLALRDLHERHGHLQEIIIQNFRPKAATRMAKAPAAAEEDHLWTIAVARIVLGAEANIQAPPNLASGAPETLIAAGINDWGGISPVTIDHVNPEAPWPEIAALGEATRRAGRSLVQRLAIYPDRARDAERWVDPRLRPLLLTKRDALGLARGDSWFAGVSAGAPSSHRAVAFRPSRGIADVLAKVRNPDGLAEQDIVGLFAAQGDDVQAICRAADALRREVNGDTVHYVVTRNINYTNICGHACTFCAFSKGRTHDDLRGKPYDLDMDEFARRVAEAWERGATEICLQGGIHPAYTGHTYLRLLAVAREAAPGIHVHAFSPLEVRHGAETLGLSLADYLRALKDAGLASLPGTAAEILDDEVRRIICPDKLTTAQWFEVMDAAHALGLRSTATIMFGHVDEPRHWARHLLRLRAHQERTGGFTELVPLPFVAGEAPIFRKGGARRGPTFREALLMHAVARLALHPVIGHIQTSWVKMGPDGARACLQAGADDLGGTLMNESITRAAGAAHGQEFGPARMENLIRSIGRVPEQRTTLYGAPPPSRVRASFAARLLAEVVLTSPARNRIPATLDGGPASQNREGTYPGAAGPGPAA